MIKETNAPEETFAFGKMLGEQAKPGEVICLNGDLGVGKTVFTKGFAEGLGINKNAYYLRIMHICRRCLIILVLLQSFPKNLF